MEEEPTEIPGQLAVDELLQPAPPASAPDPVDDVAEREAAIRCRQIILKIEEHAAGYQRSTGAAYRYVAEMVDATPHEWTWIKEYIAAHPEVLDLPYRTPAQWDDIRRQRGEDALQRAEAAAADGRYAQVFDLLDEALAHGVLSKREWTAIRSYVHNQQAAASRPPDSDPAPGPVTSGDARADQPASAGASEIRDVPERRPAESQRNHPDPDVPHPRTAHGAGPTAQARIGRPVPRGR